MFQSSVLKKYALFYVGVALMACVVVGSLLLWLSSKELNRSAEEDIRQRVELAGEDFAAQEERLSQAAYAVKASAYCQPQYVRGGPLRELEAISVLSHLQGKASSDVSRQPHVEASFLQYVVDERRCRRLAVATRDANGTRLRIASCELYLAQDGSALRAEFAHHRHRLGDAGTLHHFVGVEHEAFRMSALLPRDAVGIEDGFVLLLYLSVVGDEDVVALLLAEYCSSDAAFGGS